MHQAHVWIMFTMVSIAAITDLRTGLIPNAVVGLGAAAGVLVQLLAVGLGDDSLWVALSRIALGGLAGLAMPLVLWSLRVLGGGDVKLFAAIGLCVGPWSAVAIQLWSHIVAVCLLPLWLAPSGQLVPALRTSAQVLFNLFVPVSSRKPVDPSRFTSLRFAPAILAAAFGVCWLGWGAP